MNLCTDLRRPVDRTMSPEKPQTTEKFRSGEEAWFWTIGALQARNDGARVYRTPHARPCDPDDVVRCLDRPAQVGAEIHRTHSGQVAGTDRQLLSGGFLLWASVFS